MTLQEKIAEIEGAIPAGYAWLVRSNKHLDETCAYFANIYWPLDADKVHPALGDTPVLALDNAFKAFKAFNEGAPR